MPGGSFDASEVMPFLYIGGMRSRRDTKFLSEKKITAIINTSNTQTPDGSEQETGNGVTEIFVPLRDRDESDISKFFDSVAQKIDEIEKLNGGVLVHCFAGISRSATLVLGYLMKYKNMNLKDAHRFLKSKRRMIDPNLGFWKQLVDYEHKIFGSNSVQMIPCPALDTDHPDDPNPLMIPDIYKDAYEKMVM